MAITFGILLAYLVGLIFTAIKWQYHAMFGVGALPGALMMCIGVVMPEPQHTKDSYGEMDNLVRTNHISPPNYRPIESCHVVLLNSL